MELFITWTDETPFFRHANQPDIMEALINTTTGEGNTAQGSSNTATLQGEVRLRVEFDQYILTTELTGIEVPDGAVEGSINATIACIEAGDQTPSSFGVLTFPDDGNDFSAVLRIWYKNYERN